MFGTPGKRMCYAGIPLVCGKSTLNFPVSDGWVTGAICETKESLRNRVLNPAVQFGGIRHASRMVVAFGDWDCDSVRSRRDSCSKEGE
jgi:hypothetical protein